MSRIGKLPITVPDKVEVTVNGQEITVKGPKGQLSHILPETIAVRLEDGELLVEKLAETEQAKAFWGLQRSLVNNLVIGVSEGFEKDLELVGVGYRVRSEGSDRLVLSLGYSHPVEFSAPEGVSFEIADNTKIKVVGIDKGSVGHTAAQIRALRPPEPYKGKGIRYAGEFIRRKAGKAAKVGA